MTSSATIDLASFAAEMERQPELFGPDCIPVEIATVAAAKVFVHSGKITCRDEARAATIAVVYQQTGSKRRTAEICKCSRHTIDAVLAEMEAGGKLAPLKDRLPTLLATAAAEAAEWIREIIDERHVSPEHAATLKALGVVAGIGADKVAAAPPTEHRHVHVHVADVQDSARRYLDLLATPPPDTVSGSESLQRNELRDLATCPATSGTVSAADPAPVSVRLDAEADQGGGGGAPAGAGGPGGRGV